MAARATAAERILTRRRGPKGARRIDELRAAERRLSELANAMPRRSEKAERAAWREAYARAGAEREALALALARDFAPVREGLDRLNLTLEDIQSHLPPGSILVDFR